ncbi:alanine racemase [Halobacillus kuroshimensis]|uniref:Alanine racemase n=1 Tax=Halobacillus kuroshimensis TaxID=302481 RepID=A0ABS3E0I8_9BACI|nr:alanine racemase [Halobacillus sp. Cin3]MBN8237102.1 alanine racemase [Halobacillus kuroshimensis]
MQQDRYYRDSIAEIDLSAIEANIQQLRQRLHPESGIYAVVKADAYGHGDVQVAAEALRAGAGGLAVAIMDEALKLRDAGIEAPLLVMGWTRPEDAPLAAANDITVTVFQKEWLHQVQTDACSKPLSIHLKLDTGMGRIGIRDTEEMDAVLEAVKAEGTFQLKGIFTHFATADDEDTSYYQRQADEFQRLMDHFKRVWPEDVEIHTSNSATSMRFPERMDHFVRFGISMYGLYPSADVKQERPIELTPAFSLTSCLVHVKQVGPGESISYGATYTTEKEEWIGTVPLGYADGWIRRLQGMEVLVDGKRHPIVGRICMDQFMIRLDQEYPIGTKVTLIGKQGNDEVTTDEVADYLDTINYEIPCIISRRVPRVYRKDGKTIEVRNTL